MWAANHYYLGSVLFLTLLMHPSIMKMYRTDGIKPRMQLCCSLSVVLATILDVLVSSFQWLSWQKPTSSKFSSIPAKLGAFYSLSFSLLLVRPATCNESRSILFLSSATHGPAHCPGRRSSFDIYIYIQNSVYTYSMGKLEWSQQLQNGTADRRKPKSCENSCNSKY